MSVCTSIASDFPLTEVSPVQDYPFEINLDNGIMYDGGADDNYSLRSFQDVQNYTDKKIDDAEIWNTPDKMYPNRPSFYCLEIKR